jgi:hypothetical protein
MRDLGWDDERTLALTAYIGENEAMMAFPCHEECIRKVAHPDYDLSWLPPH